MNTRLIIPLLCAGALAFACGPRSHSDPAVVASTRTSLLTAKAVERPRRHDAAKPKPRIDSRLNVDVTGREVHFALNVANVSQKHVELSFPNGKSYDFVVVDSVGREVWHWAAGRMFTQGLQNKQLGAGDVMRVAEAWKQSAPPGHYTAIATLNSSNYPVEERVDFTLP